MRQPAPDPLVTAIVEHVATARYDDLDEPTVTLTRQLVYDALGVTLAGHDADGARQLRELAVARGGRPEATIIGSDVAVPAHAAAAANATACRALDFDDVSERALMHTTANVVPVALAAAEAAEGVVDGRELLTAVAVGIDLANRLSYAALAGRDQDSGLRIVNTNSSAGFLVAALVAGRLWKLSRDELVHALGLAYSQAAGNQQASFDAALAIRVQQGLTAGAGITAAELARRGVTGPTRSLEGQAGYFQVFWNGRWDPAEVLDGLGSVSTVDHVSIKPYPCCKHSHSAIAAALDIAADGQLDPDEIDEVVVDVLNREYFNLVCDPVEAKQRPQNPVEAQFSLPYAVAVALHHGPPGIAAFEPAALDDPAIMALARKVTPVYLRQEVESFPAPATVRVRLHDGAERTGHCEVPLGHPRRPMSWEALDDKFAVCAAHAARPMPAGQVDEVGRRLRVLEDLPDVAAWVTSTLRW